MPAALLAAATIITAAELGVDDVRRPTLVSHGASARPWVFMADPDRVAHIDGLPFAGFAYNIPLTWFTMSGEYGLFTEAEIHGQFGGLDETFANLTENMVSVVIRRRGTSPEDGDFFDDGAWSDTVEQFRRLARVAATPRYQCVGIVFDNEE